MTLHRPDKKFPKSIPFILNECRNWHVREGYDPEQMTVRSFFEWFFDNNGSRFISGHRNISVLTNENNLKIMPQPSEADLIVGRDVQDFVAYAGRNGGALANGGYAVLLHKYIELQSQLDGRIYGNAEIQNIVGLLNSSEKGYGFNVIPPSDEALNRIAAKAQKVKDRQIKEQKAWEASPKRDTHHPILGQELAKIAPETRKPIRVFRGPSTISHSLIRKCDV